MRAAILLWTATLFWAPIAPGSDFAGTWKRNDAKSTLSPPPTITIEQKGSGWHVSWSTAPAYDVIPDGQQHPLPANNIFQTALYRRLDSHTLEQDGQRGGKTAGKVVWTVSKDGKELHQRTEGTYQNGQAYQNDSYYNRVGGGSRDDPFLGKWENEPSRSKFGVPVFYTIRDVGNGLEIANSIGLTFTANFDGKDYPASGVSAGQTVSLVRIDDRTIRMVVKRKDGSISRTSTMAFVDGQLTESTDVSIPNGGAMKSKIVYEKQ